MTGKRASSTEIETLMAAVARMADRMGSSLHNSGMACGSGGEWRKLLDASARQRKALHRLMDALARAQSGGTVFWQFRYTLATIADHKRADAKRAVQL